MELSPLTAINPLDGRYHYKLSALQDIFSEYALIRNRFIVEIRWLQTLCACPAIKECPPLSPATQALLNEWITHFSMGDAERVKQIEKTTNHDLKAIEYFIKERLASVPELAPLKEMVHFSCTSEDINNLAYGLILANYREQALLPALDALIEKLREFSHHYADAALLSRTHGQAASPTTFGKEMANVTIRLKRQRQQIASLLILGKFNGAVGNFNAHQITYPEVDWRALSQSFIESFGFCANPYTTQIEPHDYLAEWAHAVMRTNTILLDLCRDIWGYISLNYIQLRTVDNEIGSSTMPHKVNPIDFENAEGNLGLANALLQHLASQLPISRWQRDLSDSTRLRNLGVAFSYGQLAYQSCLTGLKKIAANTDRMRDDLNQHWEVLSEAIQTVMRRYGIDNPYEALKAVTRGKSIQREDIQRFVQESQLPDNVKQELLALRPDNYLGLATLLARDV